MICPHCGLPNGLQPDFDGHTCAYCGYVAYSDARPFQFALALPGGGATFRAGKHFSRREAG